MALSCLFFLFFINNMIQGSGLRTISVFVAYFLKSIVNDQIVARQIIRWIVWTLPYCPIKYALTCSKDIRIINYKSATSFCCLLGLWSLFFYHIKTFFLFKNCQPWRLEHRNNDEIFSYEKLFLRDLKRISYAKNGKTRITKRW